MKKRKSLFILNIAVFEVILLISASFAVSFILSGGLVSGQGTSAISKGPTPIEVVKKLQSAFGSSTPPQSAALTTANTPTDITPQLVEADKLADSILSGKVTGKNPPVTTPEETKLFEGIKKFTSNLFSGQVLGTTGVPEGVTRFTWTGLGNTLFGALAWAGVAYGVVQVVGGFFGVDKGALDAASYAAAGFAGTYSGLQFAVKNQLFQSYFGLFKATAFANFLVAGGVATAIFILTYKKEKKKLVTFQCLPFEPPLGGAKCEECNKDLFRPCSEYRCKSLGQACQLVNPGTAEERCVWVNPKDVTSPTIEPWSSALKPTNLGLKYVPDNTIRPPNRGVKIVSGGNNCLPAFTPLEFGIILNEPAQCKIDYEPLQNIDEMQFYFGGSNYYRYNHTQKMKLPAPDTSNTSGELAPELENDGTFSLFVRCRDANGNANVDEFVFNFCVDPSPDTTPPRIEGTSIISGSPVRFNADSVPIEVYVNEPAECKWSRTSKNYEDMENSMNCATETYQINADLNYVCSGNLTGINNREDNKFYFRCKDNPNKLENERNVMTTSHELVLRGSQELNILSTGPNGTIFGSTDVVTIELTIRTDDGAEEGRSICYFSNTGEIDSYIAMFNTNSFEHKQSLDLVSGNYEYFFRCIDRGGNSAEAKTEFTVFVDKQTPLVTRAYKDEGLKIVTNEDAECVYSLTSCNYEFEEGLPLIYSNPSIKRNHFAEWKPNSVYYVKCGDVYGNIPSPNACSIIVGAVELGEN